MVTVNLHGNWNLYLDPEKAYTEPPVPNDTICLPDSTAHAQKGPENKEPHLEHMTDRFYFEGYAWYSRQIDIKESWPQKQILLFLERTRISTVFIDGKEISTRNSLCGYQEHDLTGCLTAGVHTLTIRVDNTDYPTKGGCMTSPDCQTNWNGIVGRIELQIRENQYPANLQITAETPERVMVTAEICGEDAECTENAEVIIRRKSGEELFRGYYPVEDCILNAALSLTGNDLLWDEYHPNLLQAEVIYKTESISDYFGIRKLSNDCRKLLVNEREVFLRGKCESLTFPRTGFSPMTADGWKKVFSTAKEYGINHYRFHTCCPPDAAFTAADEMGIYLEPELPFWGTITEPGEEGYNHEEQEYLIQEGYRILKNYGNHPSFIILSMGNELWGSMSRVNYLMKLFKSVDRRRMYTQGSNDFQFTPAIFAEDDVFCGVRFARDRLFRASYAMCDAPQGHVQTQAPNSSFNYDAVIVPDVSDKKEIKEGYIEIQYETGVRRVKASNVDPDVIPQIPVISHEIGQYEFFPDFTELGRYEGSMQPLYLEVFRERLEKAGLFEQWKDFFETTGALAVDCYRRELETVFRSKEMSGFQILDIMDCPSQGIALVGVLNSWMESKDLISAAMWRRFCSDAVILAELDSFVVTSGQTIYMPVKMSVSRWEEYDGTQIACRIHMEEQIIAETILPVCVKPMRLQEIGTVKFTIPELSEVKRIRIELEISGMETANTYELWAYPNCDVVISEKKICCEGKEVLITRTETEKEQYRMEKIPFLYIPEAEETDIEGTYCTDFWNYPMFRSISEIMNKKIPIGTMGLLIQKEDEVLRGFPCEKYSTPQWYQLTEHSHCAVLDEKKDIRIVVQPIDNVERCHKLGMLYWQEDVLICTVRIWEIGSCPEVKAFVKSMVQVLCGR